VVESAHLGTLDYLARLWSLDGPRRWAASPDRPNEDKEVLATLSPRPTVHVGPRAVTVRLMPLRARANAPLRAFLASLGSRVCHWPGERLHRCLALGAQEADRLRANSVALGGLPSQSGNREHAQNSPYLPFLRTRIPFLQVASTPRPRTPVHRSSLAFASSENSGARSLTIVQIARLPVNCE
jgi:hypothetical protein